MRVCDFLLRQPHFLRTIVPNLLHTHSYGRACKEQLLLNYGFSSTGPSHACAC